MTSPVHDDLVKSVQTISLEETNGQNDNPDGFSDNQLEKAFRPLYIYTRKEALRLYKSPLVQLPPGMPAFKDWFGSDGDPTTSKKEPDTPSSAGARDRRFRRDAEDGESTARPTFRSGMSQPSQMGNFKHQSMRSTDRDRDRDADRERERDIRDKEGHERLRSLSDKYDRDRLALPPNNGKNKDRDGASHPSGGPSARLSTQASLPARRGEGRDTLGKKKVGETIDDWRRVGGEPRSGREDQSSRPRESSRPRRDVSTSRRDRDDRDRRGDREDNRKDRDVDNEDSRRWRDDGKRDERIANRRERDRDNRDRTRTQESVEERDGRGKRPTGREKKPGGPEDIRGKRDREDEKEPAWMDAYIPETSGTGILGGRGDDDDELDGLQAWKKGMKEKEEREKGVSEGATRDAEVGQKSKQEKVEVVPPATSSLDEIQLFKLLMKAEGDKKPADDLPGDYVSPSSLEGQTLHSIERAPTVSNGAPQPAVKDINTEAPQAQRAIQFNQLQRPTNQAAALTNMLVASAEAQTAAEKGETKLKASPSINSSQPTPEQAKMPGSRFFPRPLASQSSPTAPAALDRQAQMVVSPTAQFNTPQGSRVLALDSGASSVSADVQNYILPPQQQTPQSLGSRPSSSNRVQHPANTPPELQLLSPMDPRAQPGFPVFDNHKHLRELSTLGIHHADSLRRTSGSSFPEMNPYAQADMSPSLNDVSNANKGSRFAKFFDGKAREGAAQKANGQSPFNSPQIPSNPRHDPSLFNGAHGVPNDNRAMDDIFAMLTNSTHGQRVPSGLQMSGGSVHNSPSFGQSPGNYQPHQSHQQQMPTNGRMNALYDSRLDDRFVPDGMVPGLRSNLSARNGGITNDSLDDPMIINPQRVPQQRGDPMFSNAMYAAQGGRNASIALQQPSQYRGGPSPLGGQDPLQGLGQQRLPPGLANLGGRPPHEPSQFAGAPMGLTSGGFGHMAGNGSSQQQFNNFGGANVGFGGHQMRGASPISHQLQNTLGHGSLGLAHPSNMDFRGPSQSQLLMSGGAALRNGGSPGYGGLPQGIPIRQQQHQQQLQQPHAPPQYMLPPHLQAHQANSHNQPAHDLMALLMGGPRD